MRFQSVGRRATSSSSSRSTQSSGDKSVDNDSGDGKSKASFDLLSSIVDAVNEGDFDALTKRGMTVTTRASTPREELDQKLSDPDIKMQILGTLDEEEEEVLRLMRLEQESLQSTGYEDSAESMDIDPSLFAELQSDAQKSMAAMQAKKSSIASLFNDESLSSVLDGAMARSTVAERLTDLPTASSNAEWSRSPGNAAMLTPLGEVWESTSPPSNYVHDEVEEMDSDDDDKPVEQGLELGVEQVVVMNDASTNEAVFAQLLKATMDATEESASSVSPDLIQNTINAVNEGDMSKLDLNLVLGDALKSLTDQLNIDMREELSSMNNKEQMQSILAGGMAELVSNMKELDEQSNALYARLETLQQELAAETTQFEEKKQDELNGLLLEQAKLQSELTKSVKNIKESTDKLENVMSDLEKNADALTAIALFPFKTTDKKVSFVLGLALLFKVPFDVSLAFSIRSADPSDWFGIAVQSGLCLALFHNYGLVQAVMRGRKQGVNM